MTLPIGNESNVLLTYTVSSSSSIALSYGEKALANYGNKIFVELAAPPTPPTTTTKIDNTGTAEVHAWTDTPGGMVAWARSRSACEGTFSDLDHGVLVVHVPLGVSVPSPTSSSGPPAPGTSQTLLHVKVKAQGSLPIEG